MRLIARLYKHYGRQYNAVYRRKIQTKAEGSKAWYKKGGRCVSEPRLPALYAHRAAGDLIRAQRVEEYAAEIAELFGVKHLWERHPQSLSEGQKRRVSIGLQLPPASRKYCFWTNRRWGRTTTDFCALVEILNKLHVQSGNTMITITHDVRCAEALCDRAYLIANGVVADRGGKALVREYFTQ